MISYIDEWVGRLLGMPVEAGLRVPAAIAAGLVVVGSLVFVAALGSMAVRRLRGRG